MKQIAEGGGGSANGICGSVMLSSKPHDFIDAWRAVLEERIGQVSSVEVKGKNRSQPTSGRTFSRSSGYACRERSEVEERHGESASDTGYLPESGWASATLGKECLLF